MDPENINNEFEPRVPRHPIPGLTNTMPEVPEVSLAFDTPLPQKYQTNNLKSPNPSTSYAQWKQQVPQEFNRRACADINASVSVMPKISQYNPSTETTPKRFSPALNPLSKTRNHPPNDFMKDSRLKYYQKIMVPSTETQIHRTANPLPISPPTKRFTKSVSVENEKLQVSVKPQDRVQRVTTTTTTSPCNCHSLQSENAAIINKLLSLVQNQNAQIQMLQGQVESLLSIRNERRELNDYQFQKSSRNVTFNEAQRDENSKQLVKEKKVSIGVMTSFELTVQDSVVYNLEPQSIRSHQEITKPHSLGKPSISSRTSLAPTDIPNVPLEQIIEDSESHLSSTLHAQNNFKTHSTVRKSLENCQGDLPMCMELPNREDTSSHRNPVNPINHLGFITRSSTICEENSGSPPVNQRNSPTCPAITSVNTQNISPQADREIIKKTPKVGWTLYDNVMCQVNEILHKTQEDQVEEQKEEAHQEINQSKFVLNGIQQSTLEQLKVFGFTFDTSGVSEGRSLVNNNRRIHPIPIDASYYPRLDYQANVAQTLCSASDSSTSIHMKALAMKYLGTKHLPSISNHSRGMEMFTNVVLNHIPGTLSEGPRMEHSPKYFMQTEKNAHNILDISSLKRQPKLL